MPQQPLTTSSYLILGLLQLMGQATPYELEALVHRSGVIHFWWMSHTQIYSECARLAGEGYLEEEREDSGRRRRLYRLTGTGREAVGAWLAKPPEDTEQTRDPALLKLFFGGNPSVIAAAQVQAHQRGLEALEDLAGKVGEGYYGGRGAVMKYGLAFERMALDFWTRLAEQARNGELEDGTNLYGGTLFGPV